ncbi:MULTISPECIES: SSI family serine proteinase inhibitor [Streptomyces]|uniref:SSI family serine proteinase inhibitor n=1 Tax=Streptomyces TaxID=1883 RepID=UPI00068FA9B7|nr:MULTISPECIES: SSI family serine proteinase inhibitor [Streptomyces]
MRAVDVAMAGVTNGLERRDLVLPLVPCGHPCGRRDCPAGDRPAHPYRAEAYSALDEAGGDFDRLRAEPDSSCTAEHAPVTLTARRTYRGRAFDRTRTYDNNCEATVRTDPSSPSERNPAPHTGAHTPVREAGRAD